MPGADYGLAIGDVDSVLDEVEEFLTGFGFRPTHDTDRVLATVLFTDIVDSTTRAAEVGDRRWTELLDAHEDIARREVARFGGMIADFTGDGLLARFDGPARAVRCALALRNGGSTRTSRSHAPTKPSRSTALAPPLASTLTV